MEKQNIQKLRFTNSILVAILSFAKLLLTQKVKCLSLNNQPCLARATFIDINPD